MKIFKEVNFEPTDYIAQAVLENGVRILIREDGTADGNDGKRYFNVSEEHDDDLATVGWTADATEPLLI